MKQINIQFQTATGISKYLPLNDMTKTQQADWSRLHIKIRLFIRNQLHYS